MSGSFTCRTIHVCDVIQKDQWVGVRIEANAFLHHMVRIIVYTLIQVGLGIEQPLWIKDLLLAKSRLAINNMAPACGLYFEGAKYKDDYHLPNFYTTLALEGV